MPVRNADIAALFGEMADLLAARGGNPARVSAYRTAAQWMAAFGIELAEMVRRGEDLACFKLIGADLADKMSEILATGRCQALEQLRGEAATDGRMPREAARRQAEPLVAWLAAADGVERVEPAGSYRRGCATVGDLDLLATRRAGAGGAAVVQRLLAYPGVIRVLVHGPVRARVILGGGLAVDLHVVPAAAYGAALCYLTGSREHNIALRRLARQRGLKLNEYGLFRGRECLAAATEEAVYAALGLAWIPPAAREGRGEIESARRLQHRMLEPA